MNAIVSSILSRGPEYIPSGGEFGLRHVHWALDQAVLGAYGWPADITDDALLDRLFALTQARAAAAQA